MKLIRPFIDKSYISEDDVFLFKFDEANPEKSASQQKAIQKHQRIHDMRDNPDYEETTQKIWEEF